MEQRIEAIIEYVMETGHVERFIGTVGNIMVAGSMYSYGMRFLKQTSKSCW